MRALEVEPQVGLLMPCNVVLQKRGATITVSAIDPEKLADLVGEGESAQVMREAAVLLRQTLANLKS